MYIYDNISFNSFTMKNILEKPIEEITTHNLCSTALLEVSGVCEICGKIW